MFLYQQTPVGEKIKLGKPEPNSDLLVSLFKPYTIKLYDSGTSALAAAILVSIDRCNVTKPEVIISAYGCPDLVSAIIFAGARPVLVDIEKDKPWIDLDQLHEKITSETVAVVAVNLFGIPERIQRLKGIAGEKNITIIEDRAQSFPIPYESVDCFGDIVVLSFGRGKPVNMLTGGAVLFLEKNICNMFPETQDSVNTNIIEGVKYRIKVISYNITISPYLYGYLEKLPFLHVGETRYEKHHSIDTMGSAALSFLHRNIILFSERINETRNRYTELLSSIHNDRLIDLPTECCDKKIPYLLRYPILCSSVEYREELYINLRKNGVGVSKMYQNIIPHITGIENVQCIKGSFNNAMEFASKLLTLPTHSRTTDVDLKHIRTILSEH